MAFQEDAGQMAGRLSLGVTSLVAGYVLSDILSRFRRAWPQVELSAIEDNGDYLQHLLIGGELDVAVMLTSSIRDRAAMHVESLLVSPYRLWLPLGHPLTDAEAIALDQLANEPLILLTVDEIEESTRRLMAAMSVRPDIAFRTRSLEGDRIEIRDVSGDLPSVQVGLCWRKGAPLSPVARAFIRAAQGAVPER